MTALDTRIRLLLALLGVLFEERLVTDRDSATGSEDDLVALREATAGFPPERVASSTGLDPDAIRDLARDFAAAPSAACYGRLGVCTQRFGGLCCWLMSVLNAVTSNLDRVGGAMFTTPAVDLPRLAGFLGARGSSGRWCSRVRGAAEFGGELPLAVLAEEMEAEGPSHVRGLVTVAGNPVLSAPNSDRLDRALGRLDFMVSVDCYLNETTRHADLVLPAVAPLERDHFDLLLNMLAVRNVVRYTPRLRAPAGEARADWRILLDLAVGVGRRRAPVGPVRLSPLPPAPADCSDVRAARGA